MKWIQEDFRDLHELYLNQLRVMLSAEEQILRELPIIATRATDEELQRTCRAHIAETEEHIMRLEQILAEEKKHNAASGETSPEKCKPVRALAAEAEEMIEDTRNAWVRDVAMIAAQQRVEHYEIAAYGALRKWAELLGEYEAASLLDQTLKEEGHADYLLTSIAERVNPKAKKAA